VKKIFAFVFAALIFGDAEGFNSRRIKIPEILIKAHRSQSRILLGVRGRFSDHPGSLRSAAAGDILITTSKKRSACAAEQADIAIRANDIAIVMRFRCAKIAERGSRMNPYFETERGKLYHGDCLEIGPYLKEQASLICIDPPYNIKKDTWDKIDNYQEWMGAVFKLCQRMLKDNGSFYWFHNKMPVIARLMRWIEENTEFVFKKFIVWNKYFKETKNRGFYMRHLAIDGSRNYETMAEYCLFYTFQDETGLEAIKDEHIKPKNKFAQYLRDEFKKAGVTNKEIAALFPSKTGGLTGCVSNWLNGDNIITKDQYLKVRAFLNNEYLRKEYEDLRKEYEYLRKEYEDLRKEYEDLRYTFNNQPVTGDFCFHLQDWNNSVWNYSAAPQIGHLTPKPVRLIENILKHSSNPGDLCMDFFGGSGTMAMACEHLNRRWILCEKEKKYCEIAAKRIEAAASQKTFEDYL